MSKYKDSPAKSSTTLAAVYETRTQMSCQKDAKPPWRSGGRSSVAPMDASRWNCHSAASARGRASFAARHGKEKKIATISAANQRAFVSIT